MVSNLESKYASAFSADVMERMQEDYHALLQLLPYEYYKLPECEKDSYWMRVTGALDAGITQPEQLAQLYQPSYNRINQEIKP